MLKKLYVGNLPYSATDEVMKDLFSQAGDVEEASVLQDRVSGRSRGFGFVTMVTEEGAQKAIDTFNGYELDGRKLTVNEARPKADRPRTFGGGGGSRGGFGGGRGPRNDY